MSTTLTLSSPHAVRDLHTFVERARAIHDGSARLIASDGVLAVYVGVFFPRGLLDRTPTVLGLRVVTLAEPLSLDRVVPLEALSHRLNAASTEDRSDFSVPSESPSIQWAAITPPRDGWRRRLGVSQAQLQEAAARGVEEVTKNLPDQAGEAVLQKVRAEVWGTPIEGKRYLPRGAGFAAEALGLLTERSLGVHTVDNWVRVTSKHGYVLVKTPLAASEEDE